MTKQKFSFLMGLTSIFDVFPRSRDKDYYRHKITNKRIAGYWSRSGSYLASAVGKYENFSKKL